MSANAMRAKLLQKLIDDLAMLPEDGDEPKEEKPKGALEVLGSEAKDDGDDSDESELDHELPGDDDEGESLDVADDSDSEELELSMDEDGEDPKAAAKKLKMKRM